MMCLYRLLWLLVAPFIPLLWALRARRGKEDTARKGERFGTATRVRPDGPLVWLHGASVGESLSLLVLIDELRKAHAGWRYLVTTGTATSAALMAKRLPAEAIHQYLPYDNPAWVARFIHYWRPDGVIWCESEIWPAHLDAIRRRGIPAVLLNGRIGARSAQRWRYTPGFARRLFGAFGLIAAQTPADAARLRVLAGTSVLELGNLKFINARLPVDVGATAALMAALQGVKAWAMASTHPGEELLAADLHWLLKEKYPDLITVIALRHPARRDAVVAEISGRGPIACRSKGETPSAGGLYLWDTLGEMGTLYDSVKIIAMGGSFARVGGHNPIEPAQFGCAIVCGPHMYNFSSVMDAFESRRALCRAQNAAELSMQLQKLFENPAAAAELGRRAESVCVDEAQSLPRLWSALAPWRAAVQLQGGAHA